VSRLLATLGLDMRLQARNRLYVVGIVVAVLTGVAGRALLDVAAAAALLPGVWVGAIGSTTFMFVAGMILLEKNERSLDALVVTPLPASTYLLSKVATLAGFAIVESLIVLVIAHGPRATNPVPLLLGLAFIGVMYTLAAVAHAVSQLTVTDFLVPGGILLMTVLELPALSAFGVWDHPILYVIPTQAPVVLLKGGFTPLTPWQWVYALVYGVAGIAGLAWLARRQFQRHIVEKGTAA